MAKAVPKNFYGLNAWMPDAIGSVQLNGNLDLVWNKIQDSSARRIRMGGIAADNEFYTDTQLLNTIDQIKAIGSKPIIQVPVDDGIFTAAQAADIVELVNVTHNKKVKFWSIGNEPNFVYNNFTPADYAATVKAFSAAMKAVDPKIRIIAGELAWYDIPWVDALLQGPDDITGVDPVTGLDYIDFFSFHTFPFFGNQTRTTALAELDTFANNVEDLRLRLEAINDLEVRSRDLRSMVTEFNINWQNAAGDDVNGLGANSFFGGQWVANMFTIGADHKVKTMSLWSAIEGGSGTNTDIGYLYHDDQQEKPLYYHYQLLAQNHKGKILRTEDNQPLVRTASSRKDGQINVFIFNFDETTTFSSAINLDNTFPTSDLAIRIKAKIPTEHTFSMPPAATLLLKFDEFGTLIGQCSYELAVEAIANNPPTCL